MEDPPATGVDAAVFVFTLVVVGAAAVVGDACVVGFAAGVVVVGGWTTTWVVLM